MNYLIDTHTHTLVSGHAYNTMAEMIQAAKDKGLKYYGITEHAPTMPGTCHEFYFQNFKVIPREYDGMRLLLGAELNIRDYEGTVDLPDELIETFDVAIASLHNPCYKSGTKEENTRAYINTMIKHPKVKIIGHPDDGRIPVDYPTLVKAAKEHHVALELNNSSLSPNSFRFNSHENAKIYLQLCKEQNVPIILGSDAHISFDIANFKNTEEVMKEVDFPEKLVINRNEDLIKEYLLKK